MMSTSKMFYFKNCRRLGFEVDRGLNWTSVSDTESEEALNDDCSNSEDLKGWFIINAADRWIEKAKPTDFDISDTTPQQWIDRTIMPVSTDIDHEKSLDQAPQEWLAKSMLSVTVDVEEWIASTEKIISSSDESLDSVKAEWIEGAKPIEPKFEQECVDGAATSKYVESKIYSVEAAVDLSVDVAPTECAQRATLQPTVEEFVNESLTSVIESPESTYDAEGFMESLEKEKRRITYSKWELVLIWNKITNAAYRNTGLVVSHNIVK